MNGVITQLVPQAVVEIVVVPEVGETFAERHEKMIRTSADIQEALLDEPTDKGLSFIQVLVDQIAVDLSFCRSQVSQEARTGT
jgi:hypothetical protein